jgi:hypothetical protein
MRTIKSPIEPEGAFLEVTVGPSASHLQKMRAAGRPIPSAVPARALMDIGAEVSCVDPGVLGPLIAEGLVPERFVFANVPAASGVVPAPEYCVNLTIIHPSKNSRANLVLRNQYVIAPSLTPLGYDLLLGRDVLAGCLLVYDGPGQTVTFGY